MFLDEATIEIKGGDGGQGTVSWRREKYVPLGGPNGGNGGRGGSVFLVADENTDTLSDFASRKRFSADCGRAGGGQLRAGKSGEDLLLKVPPGTVVTALRPFDGAQGRQGDTSGELVGELLEHGDRLMIAHGGRGGYGNAHFKSSTRQGPEFAELGEPGEERKVKLELKLVADVGIIGYPSVGKSTLIAAVSAARPKIADYPFTTLIPNLGVVTVSGRSFVVCDVPGLIEGAHKGKGLGGAFLKHIERTGILLHVLDIGRALREGEEPDAEALVADYKAIRKELEAYSPTLSKKKELVILNKADLVADDTAAFVKALKKAKVKVFASISAATRKGTKELMHDLLPLVLKERANREEEREEILKEEGKKIPILRPHLAAKKMGAYRIEKKTDGIHILGERVEQMTSMTNFDNEEAVQRFQNILDRIGIMKALQSLRTGNEPVFIGKRRVEEYL